MIAVVLTVAGCSGPVDTVLHTTTSPTTSGTGSRPPGVPSVADPIDLQPSYAHPCDALTAAQQNKLGLRSPAPAPAGDSVGICRWAKEDPEDEYNYLLSLNLDSDLLADAYTRRGARDPGGELIWKSFEPREVGGFPAVVRSFSEVDNHCEVIVDVGDGQAVTIAGTLFTRTDPTLCRRLITAAEWVVDTIRR